MCFFFFFALLLTESDITHNAVRLPANGAATGNAAQLEVVQRCFKLFQLSISFHFDADVAN